MLHGLTEPKIGRVSGGVLGVCMSRVASAARSGARSPELPTPGAHPLHSGGWELGARTRTVQACQEKCQVSYCRFVHLSLQLFELIFMFFMTRLNHKKLFLPVSRCLSSAAARTASQTTAP